MRSERDEVAAKVFANTRTTCPHDDRETRATIALADADALINAIRQQGRRRTSLCVARRQSIVLRAEYDGHDMTLHDGRTASSLFVGDLIRASPYADGTNMRTGDCEVLDIDEETGIVHLEDASRITAFCDGDYLFVEVG